MFGASLERIGGLFDQRFIVAYWSPLFVCTAVITAAFVFGHGFANTLTTWDTLSSTEQILLGIATILAITILAYVVLVATGPIIRLYEGYLPLVPERVVRWVSSHQQAHRGKLIDDMAKLRDSRGILPAANLSKYLPVYRRYFTHFPRNATRVLPTRIGNILMAAEEYSWLRYSIDAVLWWPRLSAILPDSYRSQVSFNLTPVITFLNLSTLSALSGIIIGVGLWVFEGLVWWWGILSIILGCVLARACYLGAVSAAVRYGQSIRTAFDVYRFDLLKQMRITLPSSPDNESQLWFSIGQWLFYGSPVAVTRYDPGKP